MDELSNGSLTYSDDDYIRSTPISIDDSGYVTYMPTIRRGLASTAYTRFVTQNSSDYSSSSIFDEQELRDAIERVKAGWLAEDKIKDMEKEYVSSYPETNLDVKYHGGGNVSVVVIFTDKYGKSHEGIFDFDSNEWSTEEDLEVLYFAADEIIKWEYIKKEDDNV